MDVYSEAVSGEAAELVTSPFGGRYCGPIPPRRRVSLHRAIALSFFTDKTYTPSTLFQGTYSFINDCEYTHACIRLDQIDTPWPRPRLDSDLLYYHTGVYHQVTICINEWGVSYVTMCVVDRIIWLLYLLSRIFFYHMSSIPRACKDPNFRNDYMLFKSV